MTLTLSHETLVDINQQIAGFSLPWSNSDGSRIGVKEAAVALADLNRALADFSLNERPRSSAAVAVREVAQAMEGFRHELAVQRRSIELRDINRALANFSLTTPFDCSTQQIEIKRSPNGTSIRGYASTFGTLDQQNEIVDLGAFTNSLAQYRRTGRKPKFLFQHDTHENVGVFTSLAEDSKGLLVEGLLLPSIQRGQESISLIEAGAELGFSIGFRTVRDRVINTVRHLQEIELLEISIVSFPATPGTIIHLTAKEYGNRSEAKTLVDLNRALADFSMEMV